MGFDLYLVGPSEGFFAGKKDRPEGAHIGLGATRLGWCTDAMADLGMLNGTLPPDEPAEETFAIPQKSIEHNGQRGQEDDEGSPEYAAYQAAVDRWLAYDPAAPGIAHLKLVSNDGFQVRRMNAPRHWPSGMPSTPSRNSRSGNAFIWTKRPSTVLARQVPSKERPPASGRTDHMFPTRKLMGQLDRLASPRSRRRRLLGLLGSSASQGASPRSGHAPPGCVADRRRCC